MTVRTVEPGERERLYVRWVDDRDSVRVDTAEYREGAFVLRGRVSHPRRAAMLVNEGITSGDYFAVFGTPVFLEEGDILAEAGKGLADARVGAPPNADPKWGIAVVASGVTIGEKATVSPSAMIRTDVKGGEQA